MVLMGVSLIDLVTNLLRMDLHVLNEERFLKFTLETPPLTVNQPALYNYIKATYVLLVQEQLAISLKHQKEAKKALGAEYSDLTDAERKMFERGLPAPTEGRKYEEFHHPNERKGDYM